MDYEKKYKEALERARNIRFSDPNSATANVVCEEIFPELKKSEDERIRKEIIEFLQLPHRQFVGNKKQEGWIAWLEKQGEQKHVDKIESKFKIGDWIVSLGGCYLHILDIEEDGYLCEDILGEETKVLCEHPNCGCKLWTIEDAKDGDVLAAHECYVIFKKIDGLNIKCYCTYHYLGFNLSFYVDTLQNKNAFHPATKEQRELLFNKMKEAGYEWDADKKVLVMIGIDNDEEDERYEELMEDDKINIKQNPAWSDEDEEMLNGCLIDLRFLVDNGRECNKELYQNEIEWLKGIKNRVQS